MHHLFLLCSELCQSVLTLFAKLCICVHHPELCAKCVHDTLSELSVLGMVEGLIFVSVMIQNDFSKIVALLSRQFLVTAFALCTIYHCSVQHMQ